MAECDRFTGRRTDSKRDAAMRRVAPSTAGPIGAHRVEEHSTDVVEAGGFLPIEERGNLAGRRLQVLERAEAALPPSDLPGRMSTHGTSYAN